MEYNNLYDELVNLNLPSVLQYFNNNWHGVKEEWTIFGRNKHNNYLNTTSNRVESFNQKLKLIVKKNSTLPKFFADLQIFLSSLASEKNLKAIKTRMRSKRQRVFDNVQRDYNEFLTSFSFNKLMHEYANYVFVSLLCVFIILFT